MSTTTTTRFRAALPVKIRSVLQADPHPTAAMAVDTSKSSKPGKYQPVSTRHPALRFGSVLAPTVSASIRVDLRDWAAGPQRWARR
jgi:hypothetical protein